MSEKKIGQQDLEERIMHGLQKKDLKWSPFTSSARVFQVSYKNVPTPPPHTHPRTHLGLR